MRKSLFLLSLLFITSSTVFGDALTAVVADSRKVIQDPKTKVIYYLESDLRHIAALSPDGKLLWCCEVVPATVEHRVHILSFGLRAHDENFLDVTSNPAGPAYGIINKKSGVYTFRGED